MTSLHQVVPILHEGDAVGGHTVLLRALLRDHGLESEIYTVLRDPRTSHLTRPIAELPHGPLLYQMAVVSELVELLKSRTDPFAINYHNFTPTRFLAAWDRDLTAATAAGRAQLGLIAPLAALSVGDSTFNAADLRAAGAKRIEVAPVLFDDERFEGAVDERRAEDLSAGQRGRSADWLFVGRIVPNKAQHDVVMAFALFKRLFESAARLFLVGPVACRPYEGALRRLVADLELSESVHLVGEVTPGELAAHYATADVFVCLSDHEGFCVPVLEAMHHQLPVVAYGSSAVRETVDGGGVILDEKRPSTVATAVETALGNRESLASAGRRRLQEFSLQRTRPQMWAALEPWLSSLPSPG